MSYAEYLRQHIHDHLQCAIAEAAVRKPDDAIEFIGNYLLKIVSDDYKVKKVSSIKNCHLYSLVLIMLNCFMLVML